MHDSRRRRTERRTIIAGLAHQKRLGFLARLPTCRPATAAAAEEKKAAAGGALAKEQGPPGRTTAWHEDSRDDGDDYHAPVTCTRDGLS